VSSYRYEGPKVREELAKSEAKIIHNAIKNSGTNPIEEEAVVTILATRSKLHLKSVFKHYKEISGHHLDEVRTRTAVKTFVAMNELILE
jgi:annexin D